MRRPAPAGPEAGASTTAPSVSGTTATVAADWVAATGLGTRTYDYATQRIDHPGGPDGCRRCPLAADGSCDPTVAHRFGAFEAERWDGQYIYYCPASLVFVATVAFEGSTPQDCLVCGPVAMVTGDEDESDLDVWPQGRPSAVPRRTPAEVGALARVQRALCPQRQAKESPRAATGDPDDRAGTAAGASYPYREEQRLVEMIRRGDRSGAAELINQLLAVLYLTSRGDLEVLRGGGTALVTVFSRAAIEGGADAEAIFGEMRTLGTRLAACRTLDEFSAFLVSVFHRFVGYVFDFSTFQHANAIRQVVRYVRTHYAERITLADAAREVWLSPNYLSSVFSAEMGMSLSAYVQSVRVAKSKELLLDTRHTVAEVAALTGFSDQSYFSKVFSRAVGLSPTDFRRQSATCRG